MLNWGFHRLTICLCHRARHAKFKRCCSEADPDLWTAGEDLKTTCWLSGASVVLVWCLECAETLWLFHEHLLFNTGGKCNMLKADLFAFAVRVARSGIFPEEQRIIVKNGGMICEDYIMSSSWKTNQHSNNQSIITCENKILKWMQYNNNKELRCKLDQLADNNHRAFWVEKTHSVIILSVQATTLTFVILWFSNESVWHKVVAPWSQIHTGISKPSHRPCLSPDPLRSVCLCGFSTRVP